MTNGEKFKEVFKDTIADVGYDGLTNITKVSLFKNHYVLYFLKGWWNTEYKEPTVQPKQIECEDTISRYGALHKIAEFFSNWDGDENAKLEISVRDMREICIMFVTKCQAESKLKALEQQPCEDKIIEWKKDFKEYVNSLSMLNDDYKGIMEYIDELPVTPQETCKDAWIIDSLKEFLGESYSVLTSNKKEFMSWLERLKWHVIRCDELATELRNYKKQETCEDAISRAEAIKQVGNFYTNCERLKMFQHTANEVKQTVADILSDLPPVTPQPKVGHWIYEERKRLINETDEGAEYVTDYWCKCSKCDGDFGYRKMEDAFCKYCGAKMQEAEDGNK